MELSHFSECLITLSTYQMTFFSLLKPESESKDVIQGQKLIQKAYKRQRTLGRGWRGETQITAPDLKQHKDIQSKAMALKL